MTPYQGVTRDVAYDKIKVWYYSTAQLQVYRHYFTMNPIHNSIKIDTTGGVVKRLKRVEGTKFGNIFVYSVVVQDLMSHKTYFVCLFCQKDMIPRLSDISWLCGNVTVLQHLEKLLSTCHKL